jgi:hypothetical protein
MLTNTLRCKNIVMNYLCTAEDFFAGKSNDFIVNNKHSISEIMFMIGMFNFTDLLDKFLNFEKLLKYYNSTNIFYFAMIGAIYQNTKNIKSISDNIEINNIKTKNNIISDNDITDDTSDKKDTVITKLSKFGLDSNTYKDILESYIKTNNKELFDLIKNVCSSN